MKKTKFEQITEDMPEESVDFWKDFFSKVDVNGDGIVSKDELVNYYTKEEVIKMYEDMNQVPPDEESIEQALKAVGGDDG